MCLNLISLIISLSFSPLVLALDLSKAPDSLMYECQSMGKVGFWEGSLGKVDKFDYGKDDEVNRFLIRKYDYLRSQVAPFLEDPEKAKSNSDVALLTHWKSCAKSRGAGPTKMMLDRGMLEFCITPMTKNSVMDELLPRVTGYCKTAQAYSQKDNPLRYDNAILDCEDPPLRFDTDKRILLQNIRYFHTAMAISYEKCIRLDR